jgi:hypothetical protein
VSRRTLAIDAGVALLLAIFVLIISPGVAVAGMIGLLVVIGCIVSFVRDSRRSRSRPARPRQRQRPPRVR